MNFKQSDFKQGDEVIVYWKRPTGDILLKGKIEHVWDGTEQNNRNFMFNIRANSSDNVDIENSDTAFKPTLLTISESSGSNIWITPFTIQLYTYLRQMFIRYTRLKKEAKKLEAEAIKALQTIHFVQQYKKLGEDLANI